MSNIPWNDGQERLINFAMDRKACAWFAPPGYGKTRAGLEMINETEGKTLVCANILICETVWPFEIKKWGYQFKTHFMHGNKNKYIPSDTHVDLINYEGLPWLCEQLLKSGKSPYKQIIYDELSFLKNPTSKRFKSLQDVLGRIKYRIGMTGTPCGNHLLNLWAQMYAIDSGRSLGSNFYAFRRKYFDKNEYTYKYDPDEGAEDEILDRIYDTAISLDINDLDLPPLIHRPHYLEMPIEVREHYEELQNDNTIEELDVYAMNAAVKANKLRQAASGRVYDTTRESRYLHDTKADYLKNIVQEMQGRPVMIFFEWLSDYDSICNVLGNVPALYGGTSKKESVKIVRDWNTGKLPVLALHPRCLHPETLVLTEERGWVHLIDVKKNEKVFDGVEFVSHGGCQFSSLRSVIDKFGITLTPDHKILIQNEWVEAQNVPDTQSSKEAALFGYWPSRKNGISEMFKLSNNTSHTFTRCRKKQYSTKRTLSDLLKSILPSYDKYTTVSNMERYVRSRTSSQMSSVQKLRRPWNRCLSPMVRFQEFLERHAAGVSEQFDFRPHRCEWGLLPEELSLVYSNGATGKQKEQSYSNVLWRDYALSRILSKSWSFSWRDHPLPKKICNGGFRHENVCSKYVHEKTEKQEKKIAVYDLVNCGPRKRFVVRNTKGEMFIVHNSAAHGLNLQDSGNVLIFYTLPWSYEMVSQGIRRLWRQGQKNKVFVHYLLIDKTEDIRVHDSIKIHEELEQRVIGALL